MCGMGLKNTHQAAIFRAKRIASILKNGWYYNEFSYTLLGNGVANGKNSLLEIVPHIVYIEVESREIYSTPVYEFERHLKYFNINK